MSTRQIVSGRDDSVLEPLFQVETNEGYTEILRTFTESEKCDISELELFPAAHMCIVTTDKSPYREAVSRK